MQKAAERDFSAVNFPAEPDAAIGPRPFAGGLTIKGWIGVALG